MTSATSGWIGASPKARPGLGSSRRSSAAISATSSASTPQSLASWAKSRLGDERQIGDENFHRRIVAVALLELDRQTFGEIARADAGGIEALHQRQNRSVSRQIGVQPVGDVGDALAQIAGLVDPVDDRLADEPAAGIGAGERELLGEMLVQAWRAAT